MNIPVSVKKKKKCNVITLNNKKLKNIASVQKTVIILLTLTHKYIRN